MSRRCEGRKINKISGRPKAYRQKLAGLRSDQVDPSGILSGFQPTGGTRRPANPCRTIASGEPLIEREEAEESNGQDGGQDVDGQPGVDH